MLLWNEIFRRLGLNNMANTFSEQSFSVGCRCVEITNGNAKVGKLIAKSSIVSG